MRMKGKTAIVTGGARGFGEGIVRKFLAEGAKVMIADLNGAAAERLAQDLGAEAFAVDVSKAQAMAELAQAAQAAFGLPDIVVNNAGSPICRCQPRPCPRMSSTGFSR